MSSIAYFISFCCFSNTAGSNSESDRIVTAYISYLVLNGYKICSVLLKGKDSTLNSIGVVNKSIVVPSERLSETVVGFEIEVKTVSLDGGSCEALITLNVIQYETLGPARVSNYSTDSLESIKCSTAVLIIEGVLIVDLRQSSRSLLNLEIG